MSEGYAIRRATLDDVPILVAHRRGMFEAMGYADREALAGMDAGFAEWVREKLIAEEYVGWFAVDPDGSVACGVGVWLLDWPPTASDPTRPRAYVLNMFTEGAHRRGGLARRLMRDVLAWCRAKGIRTVVLHASDSGRPLYDSLGFEPTNEMRLTLSEVRERWTTGPRRAPGRPSRRRPARARSPQARGRPRVRPR